MLTTKWWMNMWEEHIGLAHSAAFIIVSNPFWAVLNTQLTIGLQA